MQYERVKIIKIFGSNFVMKACEIELKMILSVIFHYVLTLCYPIQRQAPSKKKSKFKENFVHLCRKIVSQVITGYLPNLILQLSLKIVPPIMKGISSQQGYICVSEIERSACHKVIWFTVWNVFFANVLSASAFSLLFIFLELKDIPSKLAVSVPAQVKQIPVFI